MAEYKWPEADKRSLIGKRISRIDGPAKVSGKAKYTYDIKRPEMLYGKILRSPYAHAKIVSIDTSAAEKMPGVKAVKEADVVVEGVYGNSAITHCCLESHGQIVEWENENNVLIHPSTQGVSVIGQQLAQGLGIPAGNVHLKMDYIGGGFGSKFGI